MDVNTAIVLKALSHPGYPWRDPATVLAHLAPTFIVPADQPTPPRVPRRRATGEEIQQKADMKWRRKEWEATLRPFVADPERGVCFPRGTEVMYLVDAKCYYALSEREAAALPYQVLPLRESTPQRSRDARAVVPLESLDMLVQRRLEAAGVPMPADAPVGVMRCTGTGDAYPCARKC